MTRREFTKSILAAGAAPRAWSPAQPAHVAPNSLRAGAAAHGRRFGFAVVPGRLDHDPLYARTILEQASILVGENAMKWGPLRPTPTTFDFAAADRLVDFAEAHQIAVRGHNLCWHESLPAWFSGYATRDNAEELLRGHIRRVVGRYRGRVVAWDVVNEAVELKDGRPDGLRNSPWLDLLGPRYLDIAFETARAADPQATLFYNDYGLELGAGKRAATLALLHRLDGKVDALGLQSHLSADSAAQISSQAGSGLTAFIRELAARNLQVSVTELDVNDDSLPDEGRDEAVAAVYRHYLDLVLREPNVRDVLTWGVENKSSWLNSPGKAKERPKHPEREQHCLLFSDNYEPQAAFSAVQKAL